MKWFDLGQCYDSETMNDLDLIGHIDSITRMELYDDERFFKTLRACVKELRHRLYQRRCKNETT